MITERVRKIDDLSTAGIRSRMLADAHIIEAAYLIYVQILGGKIKESSKKFGCFYWTCAVNAYLIEAGLQPIIQGGSANFRFLADHLDDGECPTHYSYECSDDPEVFYGPFKRNLANPFDAVRLGMEMPEMHCWIALMLPGNVPVIVDWTTRYLVELAEIAGFEWTAPKPPDLLVANLDEIGSMQHRSARLSRWKSLREQERLSEDNQ